MIYTVEPLSTAEHIADAVMLASLMTDELRPGGVFEQKHVLNYASKLAALTDRTYHNAWVAYRYEQPVGLFVAHSIFDFATQDLLAVHDIWFVLKRHRHTRVAKLLLNQFEQWSQKIGAKDTYATVEFEGDMTGVVKLLEKLGYKRAGFTLVKDKSYGKRPVD